MARRLAAILLSDIVGYSRLMGLDEEGTIARQKKHREEIIDAKISGHGGRIVKTTGDGLLVEFPSVVDAVKCAVEVQKEMSERDADVPEDRRIQYRIGINLGDIVIDGDDILGDGVNIAARLEGLAAPGGICISGTVHDQLAGKLDITFEDSGEQTVKNVPRAVRVWRWQTDQAARSARDVDEPPALPDKPSIAVLPFANMSNDPEQEFFADGMMEDIITELSRFEELFVIARNTSYSYKNKPVDVVKTASELGVHFVLEGSVRKSGNRIRITTQLVDGQDSNHLWAERYDGGLEDVFDLQEAITGQIVASIAPEITKTETTRIERGERVLDAPNEKAMLAQETYWAALRNHDPPMLERAIAMAKEVADTNPKCALAYSTISLAYTLQSLWRWGEDPGKSASLAEEWAERYLTQFPTSYKAYMCLGASRFRLGNFVQADRDFSRAHELNPNDAFVLRYWAWCEASMGKFEDAKRHALDAIRLSPKDFFVGVSYLALAMAAFAERDIEGFEDWAEKAVQAQPYAPIRRAMIIAHAAEIGNQEMLDTHRTALMSFAPDFIESLFQGENQLFQNPEHTKLLLDGLQKAGFSNSNK